MRAPKCPICDEPMSRGEYGRWECIDAEQHEIDQADYMDTDRSHAAIWNQR